MIQRRKLWIALGGLGALLAMLVAVPLMIDWSAFKPQIVQAVSNATGRAVRVDGPLKLHLLPSPRLVAEGVGVAGFGPASEPLFAARRIGVAVELLPLLRKQINVRYVLLDEPVITLVTYADGSTNWAQPEQREAKQGETALAIRDFRIRDGVLVLRPATGEPTRISAIKATLDVPSFEGPFAVNGTLRYKNTPVAVALRLDDAGKANATLTLGDEAGVVTVSGAVPKGEAPVDLQVKLDAPSLSGFLDALPSDTANEKQPAKAVSPVMASALAFTGRLRGTDGRYALSDGRFTLGRMRGAADLVHETGDSGGRTTGRIALDRLALADFQSPDDAQEPTEFPYPLDLPEDQSADITITAQSASFEAITVRELVVPVTLAGGVLDLPKISLTLPGNTRATALARVRSVNGYADVSASFALTSGALPQLLRAAAIDPPVLGLGAGAASGTVRLSGSNLQLANLKLSALGTSATGSARMALAGATRPVTLALALDQLDLDRLKPAPAKASEAEADLPPITFALTIGKLLTGDQTATGVSASGKLADNRLTLSAARVGALSGLAVTASGTVANALDDDRKLDLTLGFTGDKLRGSATVKGGMEKLATLVNAQLAGAAVNADGWINAKGETPQFAFDATLAAPEATRVFAALSDSPPKGPVKPLGALSGTASLRSDGALVRLEPLAIRIGSTAIGGKGAVDTSRAVPVVTAALTAGTLDLSAFSSDASASAALADPDQRWSSEPLPVDGIRGIDGTVQLTAERIVYAGYDLRGVQMVLGFPGQSAQLSQFTARLLDGSLSAKGVLDASGAVPQLTASLTMTGVPLESVMRSFAATTPATGTLRFTGAVTAGGTSQQALVRAMVGRGEFAAENGIIRKIDVKAVNDRMRTLRTVNDFVRFTTTALRGGETRYRTLSTGLAIQNGVVRLTNAASDMDGADLTAGGTIDLPRWQMDVTGKLQLQDHAEAPPIGFAVKGPIGQTQTRYDLAGIQKFFATRVVAAGLRAVVDKEGFDPRDLIGGGQAGDAAAPPSAGKAAVGAVLGAITKPKPAPAADAPAAPAKSAEDDVKDLVTRGIGSLLKKKKPAAEAPAPPAEAPPPAQDSPQGYSLTPN